MNWLLTILRWGFCIRDEAPWKHHTLAGKTLDRAAERRVFPAIERRLHGRSNQGTT